MYVQHNTIVAGSTIGIRYHHESDGIDFFMESQGKLVSEQIPLLFCRQLCAIIDNLISALKKLVKEKQ